MKLIAVLNIILMCFLSLFGAKPAKRFRAYSPENFGEFTESEAGLAENADYYVSPDGNDEADGTFSNPFRTIERAAEAVRRTDKSGKSGITVAVKAGEYRINSLRFSAEDSGTAECPVTYMAYGDGEVVINGGITIDPKKFGNVTDENMLSRLSSEAKEKVLCYDLSESGISQRDYGKIYAIGSYHTASKYTGDWTGPLYCELFVNDCRMNLARYPDGGYASLGKVISTGEGAEKSSTEKNPDWSALVDPVSDVYKVSDGLAKRINSWKTFDDVWMFGYFKYDWADASTPIGNFDFSKKILSPKFVSMYGTKDNAPFYFFNVFEELSVPGEWYLDRVNNVLYLYPGEDFDEAVVDLSLSNENLLFAENLEYVTFNGFTFKGTRGDAINISGNNNTVSNCVVKNVAGHAIVVNGYDNLVSRNEITRTGRGGIYLSGGDAEKLIPGNNRADNNLIHDWSEIYQTYQPAVTLSGVGNICSHNEMFNSPHEAITFSGNDHIIEYNEIHDVCLLTNDGGAIYAGRRWNYYGNIIRYNCIYNIGSGDFTPDGIYMDDALSGETIYGNLLVNVPKYAIHLGGGRDLDVRNNIIINCNGSSIHYDDRARDAYLGGWYRGTINQNWNALHGSPYKSEIWLNAYPQMRKFIEDENEFENPGFVPNPAYSMVKDNLIVNLNGKIGDICDSAYKFSEIENNPVFRMTKLFKIFTDPMNGDYSLAENSPVYNSIPGFEDIPVNEIGRY